MKHKHISHITPADGNVFADLGFSAEEAAELKAVSESMIQSQTILDENKIALMQNVGDWIAANKLKQSEAALILGISRPRVSDVVNQKTGKFTLDALVMMLAKTGQTVKLSVR